MTADGLFDIERAPETEPATPGERLRANQAGRIRSGLHPLSYGGAIIRLHPETDRPLADDGVKTGLRCGGCMFRRMVGGHARGYPKCTFAEYEQKYSRQIGSKYVGFVRTVRPRASGSTASDIRSWWPACADWAPIKEEAA